MIVLWTHRAVEASPQVVRIAAGAVGFAYREMADSLVESHDSVADRRSPLDELPAVRGRTRRWRQFGYLPPPVGHLVWNG